MAQSMALWFRKTYRLAPTDPRYLAATPEEIETEYWAHYYADHANASEEEYSDDDFSVDDEVERLRREAESRDALASASPTNDDPDDWEEVDLDGE
jgi:hypothetical protein